MILGKGMAGKMRFCQQPEAGDATSAGKLMPVSFTHGMQRQRVGQLSEQGAQFFKIGQRGAIATVRFDQPLAAARCD